MSALAATIALAVCRSVGKVSKVSTEPEEEGAQEAWRAEIARRVSEIKGGAAVGRPVEEFLAELRERYP